MESIPLTQFYIYSGTRAALQPEFKENIKSEAAKRFLEMLGIEPKAFPMR